MSDRVRVGIVGLGWWGDQLARAVGGTALAELAACFAAGPRRVQTSPRATAAGQGIRSRT